jgi:Ino eighty subunit 2
VIERSSPEDTRQSIHLTVKASPNKLRKATSGSAVKTAVNSRNIVSGKRASRSSRVITEVDSDEEEDEAEAMDVDDEDDEEGEEDDEEEDMDAEGEEEDDADDITPAPRIVVSSNESIRVKPPVARDAVEEKELAMADDDDDEELSELESEFPDEDAEGEDEDAEGEEDDEMPAQNDDEEEDEDMDSDNGTPRSMSRSHTPDLSKMTRRQRAQFEEEENQGLMALSNGTNILIKTSPVRTWLTHPTEAQKKKHLTAEEHAMRRAEMARRRKNLSDKRNEEEKVCSLLLLHSFNVLLISCRWTPSTDYLRSSLQSVDARRILRPPNLARKMSSRSRKPPRSMSAILKTSAAHAWQFQKSGSRHPPEASSRDL